MTNPSDPWSRRPEQGPDDGPTEKVGPGGHPSGSGHPSDQPMAYGPGEPGAADPTEYFGQPPGPNATRVMPPADAQWGGYETGGGYEQPPTYAPGYPPTSSYAAPGYPPAGAPGYPQQGVPGYPQQGAPGGPGGPGGYQPAGFPQNPTPPPPKRNTTLWVALGIAAVVVVAIAGVLIGTLVANKDSSDNTASGTTTTGFVFPSGNSTVQQLPGGIPTIPGLGDMDQLGANMGTIATNDGTTLTITTLSGGTLTVKTDAKTQVISLGSSKVADLPVGEVVMVQGDKNADGSVQAKLIFSTSLPSGPR